MKTFFIFLYSVSNMLSRSFSGKSISQASFEQFVKHYATSLGSAVANYLLFNIFTYLGLHTKEANGTTFIILLISAFFVKKYYVFQARRNTILQPILFAANVGVYFLLETAILVLLIDRWHLAPGIAKIISLSVLSPMSFLVQKYVVFNGKLFTAELLTRHGKRPVAQKQME